jgi:hypothetical protein
MSLSRSIWLLPVMMLSLVACPKDKDTEDEEDTPKKAKATSEPAPTTAPTPAPTATQTSAVKIDNPGANPAIEAKVKAELDNNANGITGTAVVPTGAKATFQAPKDWPGTKSGDFNVNNSADKKAVLSAGGGGTEKVEAVATAAGLTACKWNPNEAITWGKDKIAAQGADGLCTKDGAEVKAAMVTGENLVIVGAWAPGTDSSNVFGAMRSAAKAAGGSGGGIAACCQALRQNAKSAPPQQQGAYLLAAGACDAARNNPNTAQALAGIRGMLAGAGAPAACK